MKLLCERCGKGELVLIGAECVEYWCTYCNYNVQRAEVDRARIKKLEREAELEEESQ
jgi:hypothetical protein